MKHVAVALKQRRQRGRTCPNVSTVQLEVNTLTCKYTVTFRQIRLTPRVSLSDRVLLELIRLDIQDFSAKYRRDHTHE